MKPLTTGLRMTLREMRQWGDNQPQGADLKSKGRAPRDRMEHLAERVEKNLRKQQIAGYNKVLEGSRERLKTADESLADIEKRLVELLAGTRLGTVTPEAAQRTVAESYAETDRLLPVLGTIERDEEAATAMIETPPDAYQASVLERFPVLVNSLPLITEDWLLGKSSADPLGER